MYIWKINPLVEDLKKGTLNQKEQMKYILAYSIITALLLDPIWHTGVEYSQNDALVTVLMLIIVMVGVTLCYRVNRNADNKDFVLRYMTLSLPIFIRCCFLSILLGITFLIGEGYFDAIDSESEIVTTSIGDVILICLIEVAYFAYMAWVFTRFKVQVDS